MNNTASSRIKNIKKLLNVSKCVPRRAGNVPRYLAGSRNILACLPVVKIAEMISPAPTANADDDLDAYQIPYDPALYELIEDKE